MSFRPSQGQQQVERAVMAAGVLGGQQLLGHRERVDQEQEDLVGEGEADAEADEQGHHADDQPRAQLDQVIHQRRARGFDLVFRIVSDGVGHEAMSGLVALALWSARLRAAGLAGTDRSLFGARLAALGLETISVLGRRRAGLRAGLETISTVGAGRRSGVAGW